MKFKDGELYLSRPGLGRIDVLSAHSGDTVRYHCTINSSSGSLNSLDEIPKSCKVNKAYRIGKFPTGLSLTDDGAAMVTFLGNSKKRDLKSQGFIEKTIVTVPVLQPLLPLSGEQ